ncbi:MAG TPA: zinc-finger domain-containing protein [Gammaproteobacteria bacterium]|jgi:uncharacterized Zn-finger protein|nr:zinc-finger domain-containing protein [Gammaproteobacteria bacterium]
MPNPHSADQQNKFETPNVQRSYEVTKRDLPLHCPLPGASLWNSHPRVFLPIEGAKNSRMLCPYCSTEYVLRTD